MAARTVSTPLTACIVAVTLMSCESSTGPVEGTMPPNALQVTFQASSLLGEGAIVLHSLDGSSIIEARAVTAPATVEFTGLDTNRVTFSIIDKYIDIGRTYITIRTFLRATAGAWVWKSNPYILSSNRYIRFSVTSPPTVFSPSTLVSLSGITYLYLTSATPMGTLPVRYMDESGKISLLYVLLSRDIGGGAFCNWTLDHTLNPGDTLKSTFDTLYAMTSQNLSLNRPASFLAFRALRGPRLTSYAMSYYVDLATFTNKTVYAADDFPASRWVLDLSGPGPSPSEGFGYSWVSSTPGLPASLTIPAGTIAASYDSLAMRFHGIITTGAVDELRGIWSTANNVPVVINWSVATEGTATSIQAPIIPDSLRAALGLDPGLITGRRLMMYDWDTVSGFDESVAFANRTDAAFLHLVNQAYYAQVFK